MKKVVFYPLLFLAVSCSDAGKISPEESPSDSPVTLQSVAQMLSSLPLESTHLQEVYDAVWNSSGNGYDEEYMMKDLFDSPGRGVGSSKSAGVKSYPNPLRSLIREYAAENFALKSSASEVENYEKELMESGFQIYWPYSEDWDGETFPVITFDPGFGAESNVGYEILRTPDGTRNVREIYVDENTAMARPVWVVNRNDDSAFTPADLFDFTPAVKSSSPTGGGRTLVMKDFTMLRNYDSWFGGASEFMIKCGSANGFKASTEAELKNYQPSVTDMTIVVKRKYKGKPRPVNSILVSDFTDQIDKVAFLVTEDDGGTRTSWKCNAGVKIKSKSYSLELDIPFNEKDDIVWRGQLSADYLTSSPTVTARLGDVDITFEILE